MNIESIPVIGPLLTAGADDTVFDALLILGPVVICLIAILGRSPVSTAIALSYTVGFVAYVGYRGITEA